jgi:hypothetical protein
MPSSVVPKTRKRKASVRLAHPDSRQVNSHRRYTAAELGNAEDAALFEAISQGLARKTKP